MRDQFGNICHCSVTRGGEWSCREALSWVWGIGHDQGLAEDLPCAVIKGLLSEAKQAEKCSFLSCCALWWVHPNSRLWWRTKLGCGREDVLSYGCCGDSWGCPGMEERGWVPDPPPNPPNSPKGSAGNALHPSCVTGTESAAALKKSWPTGWEKPFPWHRWSQWGSVSGMSKGRRCSWGFGQSSSQAVSVLLGCVGLARILQLLQSPSEELGAMAMFQQFLHPAAACLGRERANSSQNHPKLCRAGTSHPHRSDCRAEISCCSQTMPWIIWVHSAGLVASLFAKNRILHFPGENINSSVVFLSKHFLWYKYECYCVSLSVGAHVRLSWCLGVQCTMHRAWMDALIIFLLPLLW